MNYRRRDLLGDQETGVETLARRLTASVMHRRARKQRADSLSVLIIRPEGIGPAESIIPTDQAASCHS